MKALRAHQIDGARFLAARKAALLADGMRVGKTAAAIGGADLIGAEDVLWVTTGSARADHAEAFHDFGRLPRGVTQVYSAKEPIPNSGVVTISYALAAGPYAKILRARPWDLLVLDEAHALKESGSRRTKAIYGPDIDLDDGIAGRAERTWLLTGTPTPNHNAEMWTHLHALYPDAVRSPRTGEPWSFFQFRQEYCRLKSNGFGQKIVGSRRTERLRERIAPFRLRRTLADVAPDMPPIAFGTMPLATRFRLPAGLTEHAAEIERTLRTGGFDALKTLSAHSATLRRYTGLAKVEPMAEWVVERLAAGDGKVVLFAVHREVLHGLLTALTARGVVGTGKRRSRVALIDGGTSPGARDSMREMFARRDECRVMLGQVDACGEAVDFSAADEAVFVEQSWSGGGNEQAAYRIVNANKRIPVTVRFAVFGGSYDDRVGRVVARKLSDSAALFD